MAALYRSGDPVPDFGNVRDGVREDGPALRGGVMSGLQRSPPRRDQLGMKAIFLRPNIYNDRPWHDRYHDPLRAACQELNVPVGFRERGNVAGCRSGSAAWTSTTNGASPMAR